jgi:dihydrofolate reductase
MRVSILVAVAENGVIGRNGKLPWHLGDDLKQFKRLTMGHAIVMGRKTWDEIGRALPGRRSVVISRQVGFYAEGAQVVGSLDDALQIAEAAGDDEVFVIGGSEIYQLTMPQADRLYLTRVHAKVEGDAYFPDFSANNWRLLETLPHAADTENDFPFSLEIYDRE